MNKSHGNDDADQYPTFLRLGLSPIVKQKQMASADFVLGDARSTCRGAGICKISMRDSIRNRNCLCQPLPVDLISISGTLLLLYFRRAQLSNALFEYHFKGQQMALRRALSLPTALSVLLDLSGHQKIPAGEYPLYQTKGYCWGYLPLSTGVTDHRKGYPTAIHKRVNVSVVSPLPPW